MNDYQKDPWTNPGELKSLWVVRTHIKTKENIDLIISKMVEYGFNEAIVQVRGLADVLYKSKIEDQADDIEEGLDPLKYFIEKAKLHNIRVQAWLNVNMLSKPSFLRDYSKWTDHLSNKKPNWVLQDQDGISMLEYRQEDLETDWMDGAYANPGIKQWRRYFLRLVTEVQKQYDIAGIHLDFIRYPYAKDGGKLFGLDQTHLSQLQKIFPLSKDDYLDNPHYLKALDVQKLVFMNLFVEEIYKHVKKNNKDHLVSAAVWAHRKKALENVYQDWPLWLKKDYLDLAYMMIYVKDKEVHDLRMEEFYDERYLGKIVVGLGIYREPKFDVIARQINSSRALSTAGFCFFSAESFFDPEKEKGINKIKVIPLIKGE
jgi:uncharacterized lipoprotein YddW (UPF0748 family)